MHKNYNLKELEKTMIKLTEKEAKKLVLLRTYYRVLAHAYNPPEKEDARIIMKEGDKKLNNYVESLSKKYNFRYEDVFTIYDNGTVTFKNEQK